MEDLNIFIKDPRILLVNPDVHWRPLECLCETSKISSETPLFSPLQNWASHLVANEMLWVSNENVWVYKTQLGVSN